MWTTKYIRNISLAEFWLSLIALVFSLVTLLAGVTGDHTVTPLLTVRPPTRTQACDTFILILLSTNILQFNTTSLGLAAYRDPSSPLHDAIVSLVPSDLVNPPSITRYLNVKDWYSMHFYYVCSGHYVTSSSNHSLITWSRTNVTCSRQPSGYNFSLQDTVMSALFPELKSLADGLTDRRWKTQSASNAWYTGISNVFLCVVVLSITLAGKAGIRGWFETVVMSFVRPPSFLSSL
jgi:hypothetical protein